MENISGRSGHLVVPVGRYETFQKTGVRDGGIILLRQIESDVVASAPRVSILSGAKVGRTRNVTAWMKRSGVQEKREGEGRSEGERTDGTEAEGGGGRYLTR